LVLFITGVVAACVVLATQHNFSIAKVTMLNKSGKDPSKILSAREVLKTPGSVEEMLRKYGLMFDHSKAFTKENKSNYGKYKPMETSGDNPLTKNFFYLVTKDADSECDPKSTPYSVAGTALNECLPLGSATDDDESASLGVIFSCGENIVMEVFTSYDCKHKAVYSVTIAATDSCSISGDHAIYATCSPPQWPNYADDGHVISKTWSEAGADDEGISASYHECKGSTSATDLDSVMFEAYPVNNCIPMSVTEEDYSFMASNDDMEPYLIMYSEDNCTGDSYTIYPGTECSVKGKDNIYEAVKYQYNPSSISSSLERK